MKAGELRERVTLQSPSVGRDAYNAEIVTWLDGPSVWAKVVTKSGREPILADRPVMLVGYEVFIRMGVNISQKYRLMWRRKVLAIDAVNIVPEAGLIKLLCIEMDYLGDVSAAGGLVGLDFSQLDASQYVPLL